MTSQSSLLNGSRFGDIEYIDTDIVTFEDGLIGFPSATHFLVLAPKPDSPFRWLQSLEEPALAFLVTDPEHYVPDYAPELTSSVASSLELQDETPRMVMTTVNIPVGKPEEMTLNLAGPLLINLDTRKAKQIVLEDDAYTTRYRVFHTADRMGDKVAA